MPHCEQTHRSVIHRTAIVAGVVGAAGLLVPLEFGDRFVDTAGVAADDTVDKGGRVVEIVSGGQQVSD